MQDEIAAAISRRVADHAVGRRRSAALRAKAPAYEAYLKARHHQAKVTPESWELAKAYYESAVEIDPEFGLAHVGLGFYWLALTHFGGCSAA